MRRLHTLEHSLANIDTTMASNHAMTLINGASGWRLAEGSRLSHILCDALQASLEVTVRLVSWRLALLLRYKVAQVSLLLDFILRIVAVGPSRHGAYTNGA